jgi:threonine dehydratase
MTSQAAAAEEFCISLREVVEAAERIRDVVLRTPVIHASILEPCCGCSVLLKCENLQRGSAFKARGASNAVLSLTDEEALRGVVTHSSGNHAGALARAARRRGIDAHIVMPRNAARIKLDAVRGQGFEPLLCEPTSAAREALANEVQQRTGAVMIHPFNDPRVIAGQATATLELLEQAPQIDTLVVPVGGGGLLAGSLIVVKSMRPDIRVFGAEPAWADDAQRSLRSGKIEPALRTDSIADGLRTPLGTLTFPIIRHFVDDILCAQEESISEAVGMLSTLAKVTAEPSGAVPLAVLNEHPQVFAGRNVALIISGGNRDAPA